MCSTPEGDRSGADPALRERPCIRRQVLNARRRSKRGGLRFYEVGIFLMEVLNARRRSKRGGHASEQPAVAVAGAVLNARRRSKRGGLPGLARRSRGSTVLNARRRSKRGGPDRLNAACMLWAHGCSTPEGDRSGADEPLCVGLKRGHGCSTPEGDRSGADTAPAAVPMPTRACSTPEGDRSGADPRTAPRVPQHSESSPTDVLNARRRSKRGGPWQRSTPSNLIGRAQRPKAIEAGRTRRVALQIPNRLCSTPEGDRSGADSHTSSTPSSKTCAQRPKAIEAGRTRGGPPVVQAAPVLNARRRSKRGGLPLLQISVRAAGCSTPEGDRSGADPNPSPPTCSTTKCSTPEGDRSGADRTG